MMTRSRVVDAKLSPGRRALFLAAIAAWVASGAVRSARADDDSQYKVVDGIGVYYGIVPAAIVRGHNPSHPEGSMHGGPPSHNEYHLVVALFDTASSTRIEDAKVRARISPVGAGGSDRRLEPMKVEGAISYGAFFPMKSQERYMIHIEIERPRLPHPVSVDFLYGQR